MLAFVAVKHQSRGVPLADRIGERQRIRRDHVVERRREVCRVCDILAIDIILQLKFPAECRVIAGVFERELFGDVVLHAGVGLGRELELPGQFKILKRLDGHEIAAAGGLSVGDFGDVAASDLHDRPAFDAPMR